MLELTLDITPMSDHLFTFYQCFNCTTPSQMHQVNSKIKVKHFSFTQNHEADLLCLVFRILPFYKTDWAGMATNWKGGDLCSMPSCVALTSIASPRATDIPVALDGGGYLQPGTQVFLHIN